MADAGISGKGAEELVSLGRRIHLHASKKALQKELYAGLNRATKPVRADMKEGIVAALPRRYGLNQRVAKRSGLQTRSRRSGSGAGIRIVTGKKHHLEAMERGALRHPVYGDRSTWVSQPLKAGFMTERFLKAAPTVRRELTRVMADVARKVE